MIHIDQLIIKLELRYQTINSLNYLHIWIISALYNIYTTFFNDSMQQKLLFSIRATIAIKNYFLIIEEAIFSSNSNFFIARIPYEFFIVLKFRICFAILRYLIFIRLCKHLCVPINCFIERDFTIILLKLIKTNSDY